MYDNTKLEAAFAGWLKTNVEIGFGEHYAGDLLDDFDGYLAETKLLKRSPGRVAFGKLLKAHGEFESRKRYGLTFWSGLKLKNPPKEDALAPKRYQRTVEYQEQRAEEIDAIRSEVEFEESPKAREARIAAFKAELETETAEKIREVGHEKDV